MSLINSFTEKCGWSSEHVWSNVWILCVDTIQLLYSHLGLRRGCVTNSFMPIIIDDFE